MTRAFPRSAPARAIDGITGFPGNGRIGIGVDADQDAEAAAWVSEARSPDHSLVRPLDQFLDRPPDQISGHVSKSFPGQTSRASLVRSPDSSLVRPPKHSWSGLQIILWSDLQSIPGQVSRSFLARSPDHSMSFSVASNDYFIIDLYGECYVDFEYVVYYAPRVSGFLGYDSVSNLEGVQIRSYLIWYGVSYIKLEISVPAGSVSFTDSHPERHDRICHHWKSAIECQIKLSYVTPGNEQIVLEFTASDHKEDTNTRKCEKASFEILISAKFALLCDFLLGIFDENMTKSFLDFSLIDSKLKSGDYEQSAELFNQDVGPNILQTTIKTTIKQLEPFFCRSADILTKQRSLMEAGTVQPVHQLKDSALVCTDNKKKVHEVSVTEEDLDKNGNGIKTAIDSGEISVPSMESADPDDTLTGAAASVDNSTKWNLRNLVRIGENLLEKPASRVNLETGQSVPVVDGEGGTMSNKERLVKFAKTLSDERKLRQENLDDNRYNSSRGAHLNLKHAEKARILVNKIPACESGSIFEGLMPEDLNVYVTTASNAVESRWGTYYPGMDPPPPPEYMTCLGDLYSVAWMEDRSKAISASDSSPSTSNPSPYFDSMNASFGCSSADWFSEAKSSLCLTTLWQ
ncbi:hypothetical protein ZIOFF_025246 [Zingiber officinale]|uniref:Uncharacterized protein n=1 Tax=Zingiber officinale TaxID=94328 RepID=A0A8J5H1B0_ZINOF|nr:hypothetical protein ZIOFF_025246 [Zingiber officinale]